MPLGPWDRACCQLGPVPPPLPAAYAPLGGRGGHADHHDGGVGQDLLQVLVVLALVQAVAQLLGVRRRRWTGGTEAGEAPHPLAPAPTGEAGSVRRCLSRHRLQECQCSKHQLRLPRVADAERTGATGHSEHESDHRLPARTPLATALTSGHVGASWLASLPSPAPEPLGLRGQV